MEPTHDHEEGDKSRFYSTIQKMKEDSMLKIEKHDAELSHFGPIFFSLSAAAAFMIYTGVTVMQFVSITMFLYMTVFYNLIYRLDKHNIYVMREFNDFCESCILLLSVGPSYSKSDFVIKEMKDLFKRCHKITTSNSIAISSAISDTLVSKEREAKGLVILASILKEPFERYKQTHGLKKPKEHLPGSNSYRHFTREEIYGLLGIEAKMDELEPNEKIRQTKKEYYKTAIDLCYNLMNVCFNKFPPPDISSPMYM